MHSTGRPYLLIVFGFLLAALSAVAGGSTTWAQSTASVSADGLVESRSTGFRFPDGTIQSTAAASDEDAEEAADSVRNLSVNQGLYANRIREFTHTRAFVEICFKDGSILFDHNDVGAPSAGGACEPGDVGWILEANNRGEADWTAAKETCLQIGMRLPEIFEFQFSCRNATALGLAADVSGFEWMMNRPEFAQLSDPSLSQGAAVVAGVLGDCDRFDYGFVGGANVAPASKPFRCAL